MYTSEILQMLYQTNSYIRTKFFHGSTSTDEDIISYAVSDLKQEFIADPTLFSNNLELLINLNIIQSKEEFDKIVEEYYIQEAIREEEFQKMYN